MNAFDYANQKFHLEYHEFEYGKLGKYGFQQFCKSIYDKGAKDKKNLYNIFLAALQKVQTDVHNKLAKKPNIEYQTVDQTESNVAILSPIYVSKSLTFVSNVTIIYFPFSIASVIVVVDLVSSPDTLLIADIPLIEAPTDMSNF